MNKQISFSQYRTIDLGIMAVLLTVTQVLITVASTSWFRWELYVVSPVAVVTAIVMMRWGLWACLHAVLGGVVFAVASGGTLEHLAIYGFGNLLGLAAMLMMKYMGKERIRLSAFWTVTFALLVQLLMLLGRAAVAAIFGHSYGECLAFVTTDLLSVIFTGVILWVARRVDGLFEDQKHYLLRIQEENQQ